MSHLGKIVQGGPSQESARPDKRVHTKFNAHCLQSTPKFFERMWIVPNKT